MRKYVLPIVAAVSLILGAASVIRTRHVREVTSAPLPPPVSAFHDTVGGIGIVEAATENIAIGTPVGGVVTDLYVQVGRKVKSGDPLFRIDARSEDADLVVKRAAIVSAEALIRTREAELADLRNQWSLVVNLADTGAVSREERDRRRYAVDAAEGRLAQARADLVAATAAVKAVEVEIERHTVRARVDGTLLQVKVRLGEFAPAGALATPLMMLGAIDPPNVRVDVDEQNAWRVSPTAKAVASVRGNSDLKVRLEFVRFEPYVVPKKSLTGDSTERVDTRVLQVIYRIAGGDTPIHVGQQMDVFIEAPAPRGRTAAGPESSIFPSA